MRFLAVITLALIILISGCSILEPDGQDNQTIINDSIINDSAGPSACENLIHYTDWGECVAGVQGRIKRVINCTNSAVISEEVESQACVVQCDPNWVCGEWGDCTTGNYKIRTCTDSKNCGKDDGKPVTNQSCTFVNPCSNITDSTSQLTCNSLVYRKVSYCNSMSTDELKETCRYAYALIFSDYEACDIIEDSITRNTCKCQVRLDKSYCNILAPEYRDECYTALDERYSYLASTKLDSSYCNYIEDEDIKDDCLSSSNYNYYQTYKTSISSCADYGFVTTSGQYQTSRACYIYHITQQKTMSVCSQVHTDLYNDCEALIIQNLTYCYDMSSYKRDWCLANFAYYNKDTNFCREASSENNCLYTLGYWFKEPYYCNLVEDTGLKNFCIDSYIAFCESNINNCPDYTYCNYIINNPNKKNGCILRMVQNLIKYNDKNW